MAERGRYGRVPCVCVCVGSSTILLVAQRLPLKKVALVHRCTFVLLFYYSIFSSEFLQFIRLINRLCSFKNLESEYLNSHSLRYFRRYIP